MMSTLIGLCRSLLVAATPLTIALAALSASAAWAGPAEQVVAQVDARVPDIESQTRGLERDLGPGMLNPTDAMRRFEDSLFAHLVGDFEPAAEGFFALVTTGALADEGLHLDAEWYLGESLLGMENFQTAESRFKVVAEDDAHPFRTDAVLRLLELYAAKGDTAAFNALYEREIVSGRVAPTPQITYSLGRALYRQNDLARAGDVFRQVPPGTDFHAKALYHLGVIAVREGRLDDALQAFEATATLSIESADGRRVHDLALLAKGRIYYERGDFLAAAEDYGRIGGDSEYQADKLYEIIWTAIKQERYPDALTNIEIFLLAFPEHRYSAQMMLIQGHLSVQSDDWSGALVSYERVIVDYEPVRARFAALADPGTAADDAVAAVLDASRPEIEGGLPAYALAMMRADPELSRAVGVFHDLEAEADDIALSERLIQELGSAITGGGGIGALERIRFDATKLQGEVLSQRLELVRGELAGYAAGGDAASRVLAGELEPRRAALQRDLDAALARLSTYGETLASHEGRVIALQQEAARRQAAIDRATGDIEEFRRQLRENKALDAKARAQVEVDITALEAAIVADRAELSRINEQVASLPVPSVVKTMAEGGVDFSRFDAECDGLSREVAAVRSKRDLTGDRAEGLHIALDRLFDRLTLVHRGAVATETSELGRIRKRFGEEVAEVAQQRLDHGRTSVVARDVSLALTRDGFGRLEDFFAESVLNADMGIVDVYWSQKLEVADEIVRIKEEKDALLTDLQTRFKLIRQKIGE